MKIEWNKKYTTIAFYVITIVFLAFAIYVGVKNGNIESIFNSLLSGIKYICGGIIIFYIIRPVFLFFDLTVFKFLEKKNKYILKRIFSSISTLIIFVGFMYVLLILFIPRAVDNISLLNTNMNLYITNIKAQITSYENPIFPWIYESLSKILLNFANQLSSIISGILPELSSFISTLVSFAYGTLFSIVFCFIYMFRFEEREAEFTILINLIFKKNAAKKIEKFTLTFNDIYLNFYSTICAYSIVYSLLMLTILTIMGIKFSFIVSVIILLSLLIPRFGQIIAFILTTPIIFIIDIKLGIIYSVIFVALIVLNYVFVYPRLFKKIKLSSEFVLIAIVISTGLLNILGLFIGVPILAFLYSLLEEWIEKIRKKKQIKEANKIATDTNENNIDNSTINDVENND